MVQKKGLTNFIFNILYLPPSLIFKHDLNMIKTSRKIKLSVGLSDHQTEKYAAIASEPAQLKRNYFV